MKFWPYFLTLVLGTVLLSPFCLLVAVGLDKAMPIGKAPPAVVVSVVSRLPSVSPIPPGFNPSPASFILFTLLGVTVMYALIAGITWLLCPLRVSERCLRGFTFWSKGREVEWEQMRSVRFGWVGVPYAIVTQTRGPKLWLWLSLEDPRGFARAVAAQTAPDHPLHAFLRERGLLIYSSHSNSNSNGASHQ